jgi:co-chaperonin GroES (HSP10)
MQATQKTTQTTTNSASVRSLYPSTPKALSPQDQADLNEAFPLIDPQLVPLGNRILIQLRALPTKTKGGFIITQSMRNESLYDEQVGKVIAIGGSAFHSQSTMIPWPEGEWFGLGDFVRVPKFGGDKQWTYTDSEGTETVFVIFRDFDVIGKLTGSPLKAKGYFAGNDVSPDLEAKFRS